MIDFQATLVIKLVTQTADQSLGGQNLLREIILGPENGLVKYRGELKGLYVLLSRTQAGPGREVKQE